MKRNELYKLALVAIAELLVFAGGAVLIVNGHTLAGILLIVLGTLLTSALMVVLVLRHKRDARRDDD
ncbi:MAG: hypothetical protein AAGA33_12400 [Pseudomonadota bacterium]